MEPWRSDVLSRLPGSVFGGGVEAARGVREAIWWFTDPSIAYVGAEVIELGPVLPELAVIDRVSFEQTGPAMSVSAPFTLVHGLCAREPGSIAEVREGEVVLPFRELGSKRNLRRVLVSQDSVWDLRKVVRGSFRRLCVAWSSAEPQVIWFRMGFRYSVR